MDVNEIPDHITILKELLIKLGHKQLIIHPVCKSEPITDKTIQKLACNMQKVVEQLKPCDITVFVENNSKLDPIFTSPEELKIIFSSVPGLEFLLDVAHMDSIEHIKELVSVKMPKILHVADRRLEEIHEHLPIGKGNIDFKTVFNEVLSGFEGKIVFEIIQSNEDIIAAKKYLEALLGKSEMKMLSGRLKERIWEFSTPFYNTKDLMHGIKHIERVLAEADQLAMEYPQVDKDIIFAACCFHGLIYIDEKNVRDFLKELNLQEEYADKIIIAAFESQVSSVPETLEGKIVHDAHMIEGGKTFLVVKSLVTGTARGQSLEETLDYMKNNILNKGQCYLPEAVEKYAEKQAYLKDFMESILKDLK